MKMQNWMNKKQMKMKIWMDTKCRDVNKKWDENKGKQMNRNGMKMENQLK